MMPSGPSAMIYLVVNMYGEAFKVAHSKEDAREMATDEGDRIFRVDKMTEVPRSDHSGSEDRTTSAKPPEKP